MKKIRFVFLWAIVIIMSAWNGEANAQSSADTGQHLSAKEQSIITISSLTAKGDVTRLKTGLAAGLEAGLTVNEIKEVLVHLYAYCGFPRSIRGLQTFMQVLDERKAKNIVDKTGDEAAAIDGSRNKYENGKIVLDNLTNAKQTGAPAGYSAFAPIIDTFLKEHLFADIFERNILTYAQRELVTISAISAIGDAEPMLRSHLSIALNVGFSPAQLQAFIKVIKPSIGTEKTAQAQIVLNELLMGK